MSLEQYTHNLMQQCIDVVILYKEQCSRDATTYRHCNIVFGAAKNNRLNEGVHIQSVGVLIHYSSYFTPLVTALNQEYNKVLTPLK